MQIIILVAWLVPGCDFADKYITVLKIQLQICKDGRRVKIYHFNHHLKFKS